jgi:hypothetical protein
MKFFLPGVDDPAQAEAEYAALAESIGYPLPSRDKRVYSISFKHDGVDYLATVGKIRESAKWPRTRSGRDTGGPPVKGRVGAGVVAIFEGQPFKVFEVPSPSGWGNPFLVGRQALRRVEYFEAD